MKKDTDNRFLDLGSSSKSQSLSPQHHKPINVVKILPQNHSLHPKSRASIDDVPLPSHYLKILAAEKEFKNVKNPQPPTQTFIQRHFSIGRHFSIAKNFLTDGAKIIKGRFKTKKNPFGDGSTPPNTVGGKTRKNKNPIKKPSNGLKIMPKQPSKPKKIKAKKVKSIHR